MEIHIFDTPEEVDAYASSLVRSQLEKKPDSAFCFAGGNTTKPLHKKIIEDFRNEPDAFAQADAFALDDYWGVPPTDPRGVAGRLKMQILDQLKFRNVFLIDSLGENPDSVCREYDSLWFNRKIDLEFLGLGENGHLGFNEPGAPFDGISHLVPLSEETRRSKAHFFGGYENVPRYGISIGLKNIMDAQKIVLLVKGASKRTVVRDVVEGEVSDSLPASVLKQHSDCILLLDKDAASLLKENKP